MTGDLIRRELESLRQASVHQIAADVSPGSLLATLHDHEWPGVTTQQFTAAALQLASAARDVESASTVQLCQELVVSLSFYATALDVFCGRTDRILACLKARDLAIIDDLAAVRHAMRVNTGLAHRLLEQYRSRNGLGQGHGVR